MTNQPSKLNEVDFKYLCDILDNAEELALTEIEMRDNLEEAKSNLESLTRIKLAVLDLKK